MIFFLHLSTAQLSCSFVPSLLLHFLIGALELIKIVISSNAMECSGSDGMDCSGAVSEDGSLTEVSYDNLNGVTSGWVIGGGAETSPPVNQGLRVPGVG
jgi:hypothetical protein